MYPILSDLIKFNTRKHLQDATKVGYHDDDLMKVANQIHRTGQIEKSILPPLTQRKDQLTHARPSGGGT